jgi:DNA-binding MurR/RpiR family transcriptional regulator
MSLRNDVFEIPRLLQRFLDAGLKQAENVIRERRLGEGPIFVVREDAFEGAAAIATYAFESLLGRPALVRAASAFGEYTIRCVVPTSAVLAVSRLGQSDEVLRAATLARARGAALWAVTAADESPLAKLAHAVIPVFLDEECSNNPAWVVGASAAMIALPMVASRILRRLTPEEKKLQEEFFRLPRLMEDMLTRVQGAARSLGGELASLPELVVSGAGFYHSVALQAAKELRAGGILTEADDLADLLPTRRKEGAHSRGTLLISGSDCLLKRRVHEVARRARLAGEDLFAITDSNDQKLSARSRLALLLPPLQEPSGALLALSAIEEIVALFER